MKRSDEVFADDLEGKLRHLCDARTPWEERTVDVKWLIQLTRQSKNSEYAEFGKGEILKLGYLPNIISIY